MSAFILTDKQFSAVAYAVMPRYAQGFANKLKQINIASVNYRYSEKTRKARVKLDDTAPEYNLGTVCILIDLWDYQSCEDGGSIDYLIMKAYLYEWVSSHMRNPDYDVASAICPWTI